MTFHRLMTSHYSSSSPVRVLLLLLLLFWPSHLGVVVVRAGDVPLPLRDVSVSCDCCYVSPHSPCCIDCLASLTPQVASEFAPFISTSGAFGQSEEGEGSVGGAHSGDLQVNSELGGQDSSAPPAVGRPVDLDHVLGCQCCLKGLFYSRNTSPSPFFISSACCSVCIKSLRLGELSRRAATLRHLASFLPPLQPPHSHDLARGDDAREQDTLGLRTQKRMTSMDCMCCMNSGITDCCGRCRIF